MDHSKTQKKALQYLIYILSHQSNMHDLHAYTVMEHSHILYSINKDMNKHTLQTHKHTHESCGVRIYCVLSVLVQEGLCAAAAVGLTSKQYHCHSSAVHKATGPEFSYSTMVWKKRNFLLSYEL